MNDLLHVTTFTGPFGFIKPWTAVRDKETYSQQFLTPSTIEGIREKLGVSGIQRHRLTHRGFNVQQERTQSAGYNKRLTDLKKKLIYERPLSILTRGVLLEPTLYLAFASEEDANRASTQHICLCRNEDLVLPKGQPRPLSLDAFERIEGYELLFGMSSDAFMVGYNRFENGEKMYGTLTITGQPIQDNPLDL